MPIPGEGNPFRIEVSGIDRLARRLTQMGKEGQQELRMALNELGTEIRNEVVKKASLRSGPRTGRIYRHRFRIVDGQLTVVGERNKPHQASAPGEPPAPDEGARGGLLSSIDHRIVWRGDDGYAQVGSDQEYAPYLEFGHSTPWGTRVEPRPFLRPAVEENMDAIIDRFHDAINRAANRALFS